MKLATLHRLRTSAARAAALQRAWEAQRKRLLDLPAQLGFGSIRELRAALDMVETDNIKHREAKQVRRMRKKRAVINEQMTKRIHTMVTAGHTNAEVAAATDISVASVQNIKTKLGLVRKRKDRRL